MPPTKPPRQSTSKVKIAPTKSSAITRKRQVDPASDSDSEPVDSLGLNNKPLQFDSDDGLDDEELEAGYSDQDDDELEGFPELDVGESEEEGEFEGDEEDLQDEVTDSEEEEELEEPDSAEEAALLAEIEAEDAQGLDSSSEEEDGSDLDSLIQKNTFKPDESATPITSYDSTHDLPKDYMKRSRVVKSDITGEEKTIWDEEIDADYASDSSTEETTNRIGNVPAYFYDDLPHIGYDINGKKVMRPAQGDELDKFLEGIEDADGGW